jgi:RNase H-fold protein (predicted Holliday junction resolvase)
MIMTSVIENLRDWVHGTKTVFVNEDEKISVKKKEQNLEGYNCKFHHSTYRYDEVNKNKIIPKYYYKCNIINR